MTLYYKSKIFLRFKYAEEWAHDLDREGLTWRMTRAPDEIVEEDGETYVNPQYLVEWWSNSELP